VDRQRRPLRRHLHRGRFEGRGARKGRNLQTGEAIKIAARQVLKFEPAKAIKEGLNTKRRARRKG
jgi:DNA-binding protein HU-beta